MHTDRCKPTSITITPISHGEKILEVLPNSQNGFRLNINNTNTQGPQYYINNPIRFYYKATTLNPSYFAEGTIRVNLQCFEETTSRIAIRAGVNLTWFKATPL